MYLPSGTKETFYFDRYHDRGPGWHRSLFRLPDPLPPDARVGEVSPSYFVSEEATERLRRDASDCRIVVTLRHPYRRLVSAYYHHQQSGTIPPSIPLEEAIETLPSLMEEGRYATHLRRWLDAFGRERVSVLFLEDLEADPEAFCGELCRAIDLDPAPPIPETLRTGPVGGGELPRSFRLSALARRTAARLRERNLFGLVRLGRRLGLRRLLMGGRSLPGAEPEIPAWARTVLRDETESLAELGVRAPPWDL